MNDEQREVLYQQHVARARDLLDGGRNAEQVQRVLMTEFHLRPQAATARINAAFRRAA